MSTIISAFDLMVRRELFKKLQAQEFLPGAIFAVRKSEQKNTLLHHLATDIPEYFRYYAKSCVDYLRGNKSHPKGNPTLECHDYFRIAKKFRFPGYSLLGDYQKAKRFKKGP